MLTLEFEEHRTNEQGKEQFEEYDWWKELVRKAAEKADSFQLRCWEDEKEGIAFGEKFGTQQESSTKEIVFTGTVTEQMMDELTENCVGSDGCLKYFTIAFYTGNQLVFESAHYGYEIYWLHTGFAEMGFMMTLAKNHPLIKGFHNQKD